MIFKKCFSGIQLYLLLGIFLGSILFLNTPLNAQQDNYNYVSQGVYESILDLLTEVKANPNNYNARILLAHEYKLRKDDETALLLLAPLDESEILNSKHKAIYDRIISEYKDSLRRDIQRYSLLIESMPINNISVSIITNNELKLNEFSKSKELLLRYLDVNPNDDKMRSLLVKTSFLGKDYTTAFENSKYLYKKYPQDKEYEKRYYVAASLLKKEDVDYEEYFYETGDTDGLYFLAVNEFGKNDKDDAVDYLEEASALNYTKPDFSYIMFNANKGEVSESVHIYVDDLLDSANTARDSGNCALAAEYLVEYTNFTGRSNKYLLMIADDYYCAKNYKDAEEFYSLYLEHIETREVRKKRANCFVKQKDYFAALDEYIELSSKYPKDSEIKLELARLYFVTGLYPKAREVYAELIKADPEDFQVYDEAQKIPKLRQRVNRLFPHYLGYKDDFVKKFVLQPVFKYYADEDQFVKVNSGGWLNYTLFSYLDLGLQFHRNSIENSSGGLNYSNIFGSIKVLPYKTIVAEAVFGNSLFENNIGMAYFNGSFSFSTPMADISLFYIESDAVNLLNDVQLVNVRLKALKYGGKISGVVKEKVELYAEYFIFETDKYIPENSDILRVASNIGNELLLAGKFRFKEGYKVGYKFIFQDYKYRLPYYYSPELATEHIITGELPPLEFEPVYATIYGGFGVYKDTRFLTKELGIKFDGKIAPNLFIKGDASISWNYRYEKVYNSKQVSVHLNYHFN